MRLHTPTAFLALLLLAACAQAPVRNPLATWVPSPNFNERKPVVIVLHATEQQGVQQSLETLRSENRGGKVSSHYLIGEDGRIYQLVADLDRAWHAGAGRWGTITDLNSASIGIELDNDGEEAFPEAQLASLIVLLEDLTTRHNIPKAQLIAHSDLAPTRKVDPNARFPWQRLAQAGFGIWPQAPLAEPPPGFDPMLAMRVLGYPMDDPAAALRAFRRRFRGIESDAHSFAPEIEDARILHALTAPGGAFDPGR